MKRDLRIWMAQAPILSRLVLINIGIFLAFSILHLLSFLFALPVGIDDVLTKFLVAYASPTELLYLPWGVVTYQFLHAGLWHLLGNMFMLYFGGVLFSGLLGEKRMLRLYLFSGIVGALFFSFCYQVFPIFSSVRDQAFAMGASASVLGIVSAIAVYTPTYRVRLFGIWEIQLRYLALLLVLLDLVAIPDGNAGGHLAHLGGAGFGAWYAWRLKNGHEPLGWWMRIEAFVQNLFSGKTKPKSSSKQKGTSNRRVDQNEVDAILDKISKSGYESLTKAEKEVLFRASGK